MKLYNTIKWPDKVIKYFWPIANYNHWRFTKTNSIWILYTGIPTEEQQFILERIKEGNLQSWIIYMKTWKGKTHIIFQLLELYPVSTLILCHNIKVAHETKEKLIWFTTVKEQEISLLTSKSSDKEIKKITITTHKNFKDNYEKFQKNFTQIIYDECDINISFPNRANAGHCMSNCIIMSDCDIIWGLTGTPYRDNLGAKPLTQLFGEVITQPDQANNWYHMIPAIIQIHNPTPFYTWNTWSELIKCMAEDEKRKEAQIRVILDNHRKCSLVLFDSRYECDVFEEELQIHTDDKVPIIKMYGGQWRRETEANAKLLSESNSYIIVWTTDMMWRWVDIPAIDTIFMYSSVKFKWTIVQAVGRCLRKTDEEKTPVVVDWCDIPLLNKQMRERTKAYKLEYWKDVLISKIKL